MNARGVCARAGFVLAVLGLVAITGAYAQAPKTTAKAARKPADSTFKLVLEPRATDLLKAMSGKLAAAKSMTFTATVGYEYPSKLGPPIQYTTRYDVAMQRPDKLRVLSPGDGPASEFYYDGKSLTAFLFRVKRFSSFDHCAGFVLNWPRCYRLHRWTPWC